MFFFSHVIVKHAKTENYNFLNIFFITQDGSRVCQPGKTTLSETSGGVAFNDAGILKADVQVMERGAIYIFNPNHIGYFFTNIIFYMLLYTKLLENMNDRPGRLTTKSVQSWSIINYLEINSC